MDSSDHSRDSSFTDFADRCCQSSIGKDGNGNPAGFLSQAKQREYWIDDRLDPIISRYDVTKGPIRKSYLQTLSILTYNGDERFITHFVSNRVDDSSLPIRDQDKYRPPLPHDPATDEMLERFRKEQWRFCPLFIDIEAENRMQDQRLDKRQILPIKKETVVSQKNGGATVKMVELHQDCTNSPHPLIFKEFECKGAEEQAVAYEKEMRTYTKLNPRKESSILQWFGSFRQDRKCTLILEYANGGTLADWFRGGRPPQTRTAMDDFWEKLMKLCLALGCMHNMGFSHADVKPPNIFVFHNGSENEKFGGNITQFKLGDFNSSTPMRALTPDKTGIHSPTVGGTRTYSSPELCRLLREEEHYEKQVPLTCDVWSMGGVLSEALVWHSGGPDSLKAYRARRQEAAGEGIKNGGYEFCFHDGSEVLPCVPEAHDAALRGLAQHDSYSRIVKERIENDMLQPQEKRKSAIQISRRFTIEAEKGSRSLEKPATSRQDQTSIYDRSSRPNISRTPTSGCTGSTCSTHGVSMTRPASPQPFTVNDVNRHLEPKPIKDQPAYTQFERQTAGRDFVFVIDDSDSMRQHSWLGPAKALFWIVRQTQATVELRFTSNPTKAYRDSPRCRKLRKLLRRSDPLLKAVGKVQSATEAGGSCNMYYSLNAIFTNGYPRRRTSVIVFTDGVWEKATKNPGGGVEIFIKEIAKAMDDENIPHTNLTVQLLRFGDNPTGISRLKHLDDEVLKGDGRWDFVDHKTVNDDVFSILIGSVSADVDIGM